MTGTTLIFILNSLLIRTPIGAMMISRETNEKKHKDPGRSDERDVAPNPTAPEDMPPLHTHKPRRAKETN